MKENHLGGQVDLVVGMLVGELDVATTADNDGRV